MSEMMSGILYSYGGGRFAFCIYFGETLNISRTVFSVLFIQYKLFVLCSLNKQDISALRILSLKAIDLQLYAYNI